MIKSRTELKFFIMADMMMNRGKFKWTLKDRLKHLLLPDYVMQYLKSMRWASYMTNNQPFTPPHLRLVGLYHQIRYRRLGVKLGFSIGSNAFGYGLVIPHYGTIVVGGSNRVGNYAVLHTSICITNNGKEIGDALYVATGAKITSKVTIGDNVSVGANSVVNKSFDSNMMIAGTPATKIKDAVAWYIRDGESYHKKVQLTEELKRKLEL